MEPYLKKVTSQGARLTFTLAGLMPVVCFSLHLLALALHLGPYEIHFSFQISL